MSAKRNKEKRSRRDIDPNFDVTKTEIVLVSHKEKVSFSLTLFPPNFSRCFRSENMIDHEEIDQKVKTREGYRLGVIFITWHFLQITCEYLVQQQINSEGDYRF